MTGPGRTRLPVMPRPASPPPCARSVVQPLAVVTGGRVPGGRGSPGGGDGHGTIGGHGAVPGLLTGPWAWALHLPGPNEGRGSRLLPPRG